LRAPKIKTIRLKKI
jgi:hypothetical protein